MTEIGYAIGDATAPRGDGFKLICHACNDIGGWGAGFTGALSRKWRTPESAYRDWSRNSREGDIPFDLGRIQFVPVCHDTWVVNMVAQHGVGRDKYGNPPIRYDALEECLDRVSKWCFEMGESASVHMPRIGCGLAGGKWDEVEKIIKRSLCERNIPVTVYDLR